MKLSQKEFVFNNEVVTRFDLYNSLFLTLPFYQVKYTGTLLPFFTAHVEEGISKKQSPVEIIENFFDKYQQYINDADRFHLLFRFIQYIERQVVLFDAIEDSAFSKLETTDDSSSLQVLLQQVNKQPDTYAKVREALQKFSLRLVLTAHPTQFYPGSVLGIITELTEALKINDINQIYLLLQQLGKTPFFNKEKPTPVDEAVSLAWFLENVFYQSVSSIKEKLDTEFDFLAEDEHQTLELGFWPGGDRDGNPNVNLQSTQAVTELLRKVIYRCYARDYKELRKRLTFRGVEQYMAELDKQFNKQTGAGQLQTKNQQAVLLANLEAIKTVLQKDHDGLFSNLVDDLIRKVKLFGDYFATLDIRQDSRILRATHQYCLTESTIRHRMPIGYHEQTEEEKLKNIRFVEADFYCPDSAEDLVKDTLDTIRYMREIQETNGEKACHRFIISNCQEASDILQLINLFLWSGWKAEGLTIDFVPLFETVNDLQGAAEVMEKLYTNPFYIAHLKKRNNRQTIMLGFSDSTKDGGYLMANWSIYKAKVELTAMSRKYDIDLAFFDGRGGPPARGGGKTHRFYASMGHEIANDYIQLTIQGQTISTQYGSIDSAKFNIEQLINAGIVSALNQENGDTIDEKGRALIENMATESYRCFMELRRNPLFLPYLENLSPLKLLSEINISSRPVKRNSGAELKLEDLRAISFVTAWSQLKQNIPGFYGVGTALKKMETEGKWEDLKTMYRQNSFFKTIIDNCMMSMSKSNFNITANLADDPEYGGFWTMLKTEFELTCSLLLKLSDTKVLMEESPVERQSIALREKIIMPLVVIQHYALQQLHYQELNEEETNLYHKLIIRTVYGIVNAGRNLA
ncbi:MAG: phosphoenolpyruvate carboxylase [Mucilaginibacter sp.]|uniref:phosphoenolpyruvate carboxylase n=1 Tax=Mucilaginibacter sp. TaxID=1882438 RepID=UPI0034E3F46F